MSSLRELAGLVTIIRQRHARNLQSDLLKLRAPSTAARNSTTPSNCRSRKRCARAERIGSQTAGAGRARDRARTTATVPRKSLNAAAPDASNSRCPQGRQIGPGNGRVGSGAEPGSPRSSFPFCSISCSRHGVSGARPNDRRRMSFFEAALQRGRPLGAAAIWPARRLSRLH